MTDKYICPLCGKSLIFDGKSLICEEHHCYDVSRRGYVNLLPANFKNSASPGDNDEMIKARLAVMSSGYYSALADGIIEEIAEKKERECILDAGCGEGYLSGRVKQAFPESTVIATDISKPAIVTAAKNYEGVNFAVASSHKLPVGNGCADVVVCTFAPAYATEFARVLKKDGIFIRVIPAERHLFGLKEKLYATPRENEIDDETLEGFTLVKKRLVTSEFTAKGEMIYYLIKMTPYFYHTAPELIEKITALDEVTTNQAFLLRIYAKTEKKYSDKELAEKKREIRRKEEEKRRYYDLHNDVKYNGGIISW